MSGYVIDTNVISEYNREGTPNPGVVKWITAAPERRQRQHEIRQWFENDLPGRFAGRCWRPLWRMILSLSRGM